MPAGARLVWGRGRRRGSGGGSGGAGLVALLACIAAFGVGCGSKPPPEPVGISHRAGPGVPNAAASFAFDSLDERPVSSEALHGRPTVIAFVTTGDIIGQAQVDFLVAMAKHDGEASDVPAGEARGAPACRTCADAGADDARPRAPRVNYVLVALHPRREVVLVETYRKALDVKFPVALADASVATAAGPFGEIPAVPTVVILDRQGRMVFKHTGLVKSDVLRAQLRGL